MKTSINFKAVKSDSETHNFRRKIFDYIRKDLTEKNEYWLEEKISDRLQKIESYCKEKSGRKLQKNALPIREAVVVIKEDTTLKDLHYLAKRLEEELRIRIFQIAVHKDEGHYDKEAKEWKPNLHAHLVADWQDLETGKTLKHQSFHYSKMQDLAAECLGMERGVSGSMVRLEAIDFKIQKKEEELSVLNEMINEMKSELSSKKFEDLIVKQSDLFGFKRIKTDKTIENYEKTFKTYNTELLKNKTELKSKSRQINDLQKLNVDLKKEISQLKNKQSVLLTNSTVYKGERKKYMDSTFNTIKKTIKFERLRNQRTDRDDPQKLLYEMNQICKKVSDDNSIPFSAFEEIFKDSGMSSALFSLLQVGENNSEESDKIIKHKKKRSRKIV
ncbi:hypothetical protein [Chryseobacterium sp. ISL-6]|uniref:hypothetical protein n=1 Tax=Chryseobacterium sp. ISL-6 TaxID=2819143 RepID=UPI001BE86314|nr:hypothetical protein [Chryseobacterium sp. ISL-6]MBT2416235.1 hypothetical protein [Streptomyces sp. ISL-12]MBT2620377.1 hypothetical protein [Chryseobacterium sp. ISL-6]